MSDIKVTRSVTVTNCEGLHARAAASVAGLVRRFESRISLVKNCERAEATEVLQLLSLGAAQGEELRLEATGQDAEEAVEALVRLFAGNFAEDGGHSNQ
ncbi:MAG TPA: HPr family phosphocarrier protein [Thermoguttaceae bacterium]|nr:HPr family phosphocarrier protein [Thermoguttaceae bacterium]